MFYLEYYVEYILWKFTLFTANNKAIGNSDWNAQQAQTKVHGNDTVVLKPLTMNNAKHNKTFTDFHDGFSSI